MEGGAEGVQGARTEMWRCDEKMEGTRAGEIMDRDGVSSRKNCTKVKRTKVFLCSIGASLTTPPAHAHFYSD